MLIRGLAGAVWVALVLLCIVPTPTHAQSSEILIRPDYREGETLNYNLLLQANSRWNPTEEGQSWVVLETDFTFGLRTKAIRPSGAATFTLHGQKLAARGDSHKGVLGIETNTKRTRLLTHKGWTDFMERSPFDGDPEMTLTLGDRFQPLFSTHTVGLRACLLPQVNHAFWWLLTTAPKDPVTLGSEWEDQFKWQIPHAAPGNPLQVRVRVQVLPQRTYRKQPVIPIRITARMTLEDTEAILRNGDKVTIDKAVYEADGTAYWHVARGILCFAKAEESLKGQTRNHPRRQINHQAEATLKLLSTD